MSFLTRERPPVDDGWPTEGTASPPGPSSTTVTVEPPRRAPDIRRPGRRAEPAAGSGEEAAGDSGRARHANRRILVWVLRLPITLPFVFMAPEFVSLALGRPQAVGNISSSEADVLGTSALLLFFLMLTVTPLTTVTGWHWHRPLRRDYGIAMFVVAWTDLVFAATTTGDTFPGGFLARVGGHTFLFAGTLSALLLVPLAMTANRRAQRWLGPHWKWLHRLVYVIWVTILLHLALLFAFRSIFVDALLVSAPLALMRLPAVRDRWAAARKARSHKALRWAALGVLAAVYGVGFVLLARVLVSAGLMAFAQHPSS